MRVMNKYITNSVSGIWNSYGCPPEAGAGITISIEDTPGADPVYTGSLADLVGFPKQTRQIGTLSDTSQISELVVMLPMLEADQVTSTPTWFEPEQPTPIDPCAGCDPDPCDDKEQRQLEYDQVNKRDDLDLHESTYEQGWLFKIKEELINKILDINNMQVSSGRSVMGEEVKIAATSYKQLTIYQIKDRLYERISFINTNNSIVKLMFAMVNYNFPPHLNWLLNKNLPPLAMYCAEFKMQFTKTDLSDIWQGTMPMQAKVPISIKDEFTQRDTNWNPEGGQSYFNLNLINSQTSGLSTSDDEIVIEHFLGDEEIFSGYDLNEISDIKLKVFKCKWRSDGEYNSLIKGKEVIRDEKRWYGYNWPYDYCSIVEYLQIQAGEVHDFEYNETFQPGVLKTSLVVTEQYEPQTGSIGPGNLITPSSTTVTRDY